jgi:hypothetical protein
MKRGTKFLAGPAMLLLAACSTDGKLEIRPIAGAQRATAITSGAIAEAYAQLSLGNAGLALEQFRKATRDEPDNPQAFTGMARCYDMMGRYDLSRRNYETALAIAPRDPEALEMFAVSLQAQGLRDEAASVRAELAAALAIVQPTPPPEGPSAIGKSVTIALPPVSPAPPPSPAPPGESVSAPIGTSVTIALPSARPVDPSTQPTRRAGPRLVRVSLGEVALMTSGAAPWRVAIRTADAGFVPLKPSAQAPVRLLNAARIEGLAARTRSLLRTRGWTTVAIGNAPRPRSTSLILYPDAQRPLAERMAAQFGLPTMLSASARQVTILLGRDAPVKLGRG